MEATSWYRKGGRDMTCAAMSPRSTLKPKAALALARDPHDPSWGRRNAELEAAIKTGNRTAE